MFKRITYSFILFVGLALLANAVANPLISAMQMFLSLIIGSIVTVVGGIAVADIKD